MDTLSQECILECPLRVVSVERSNLVFPLCRVGKWVRSCSVLQVAPFHLHQYPPHIFFVRTVGKLELDLLGIHILRLSE